VGNIIIIAACFLLTHSVHLFFNEAESTKFKDRQDRQTCKQLILHVQNKLVAKLSKIKIEVTNVKVYIFCIYVLQVGTFH